MKVISTEQKNSVIGKEAVCEYCQSRVHFDQESDCEPCYYEGHGFLVWWWTCPYCGCRTSFIDW